MHQPYQVIPKRPLNPQISSSRGFVLLEVLMAMSLILGVWMALVSSYQNLALRTTQTESKRALLRGQLDAFEVGEQVRASSKVNIQGPIHESFRVSHRNRAKYATYQPTLKNKR